MLKPRLTDPKYLEQLLQKHRLTPNRAAGQNFLISPEVVEATILSLQGGPWQVTELGAGLGPLTQGLVGSGYTVHAIERDANLAHLLPSQLTPAEREHLQLEIGDLKAATWTWDTPYSLVGNIPYNLSGLILRQITQLTPTPDRVILLVQKEVGERLVATPPQMSLLSLAIQLWGTATILMPVPADCFWPAPQVDSALVMIMPHATPRPLADRERILSVAKPIFQMKRKQLGGTLQRVTHYSAVDIQSLLEKLQIAPTARPQELSVEDWAVLTAALS